MVTLVIGGSGSGKSAYAEDLLQAVMDEKYYLATMQVYDDEMQKKVDIHRRNRAGKGFQTIEKPVDIGQLYGKISGKAVLLECMSNLVANEMWNPASMDKQEWLDGGNETVEKMLAEKIVSEITLLGSCFEDMVIVSNNIFEDGLEYDAATKSYLRVLAMVNHQLAERADRVFEVVVGIPIAMKG